MEDALAEFTSITGATLERAQQYLTLTENNLEQAIQLYFDAGGVDMGTTEAETTQSQPVSATTAVPSRPTTTSYREDANGAVLLDSDDEDMVESNTRTDPSHGNYEDDEAMARRLQEEAYGSGGVIGGQDDVRAPMARTTETLVGGPDLDYGGMGGMRASLGDAFPRPVRRPPPGIFNQQPSSVWDERDPLGQREQLSRATGGASDTSSKSNLLAELFRPPIDLIYPHSWDEARDQGKEEEKWILVNIQDPSIFDCQVLNRDIWKNPSVRDTVTEHFIFMQYTKDDPKGGQYINYYFQRKDDENEYPHVAIVDPRTGEQVKVWSGPPVPKPSDFLMDLHEFLDRYSLKVSAKNPVANRKPEQKMKTVDQMTEEEMMELALQNSMQNGSTSTPIQKAQDPDSLTKIIKDDSPITIEDSPTDDVHMEEASESQETPFTKIPSDRLHTEPEDPSTSTRIQFRWSGGRVVRRFTLTDKVQRIYEWLKAEPLDGKTDVDFELIAMGKNLITSLDETVEEAGLKNGTVMVEHLES